jgi:hypothetical protein
MRSLAKPEVLESAALAGLLTAVVCYPRLYLATKLNYPVWYLEAMLFLGSIVLWAFVFAWHTQYSGRPVLTLNVSKKAFAWATGTGLAAALVLRFWFDPMLRARTPEDYPLTVEQWAAMTLFSLAFTQLFLVFAPFAWTLRLVKRELPAIILTVVFGLYVLLVKIYGSPQPPSLQLWVVLVVIRIVVGLASVLFFLRGGLILIWWWSFLLQSRHLLALA